MIDIRTLHAIEDLAHAVALQGSYWGDDLESVIPVHMLLSIVRHGGHVLAAFDGRTMAGVLVGFLGTDDDYEGPAAANLQIFSKRMVVLPEFRNQGLAYRLKLAQRELAIRQGIGIVSWTFDPMMAANAHLNIRKLGAIGTRFRQNYYGTEPWGGLVALGASDRLVMAWHLTDHRVEDRVEEKYVPLLLQDYLDAGAVILNPSTGTADAPQPATAINECSGNNVLLEIPLDYREMLDKDEVLAQVWLLHIREQMQRLFESNYQIVDFVRAPYEGRDRVFYGATKQGKP